MIHRIAALAVTFSLSIQFDGSLRPPRDPEPGIATSGVSKKIASCGAAVLLDDDRTVVALCGRYLPAVPGISSADSEYEGLLLGLEWVVNAAKEGELDSILLNEANAPVSIVIRGDCKTVIDQLQSTSLPRKLRPKYDASVEQIEFLKEYAENKFGDALSVIFEHVPREKNVLCDALCSVVLDAKQIEQVAAAREAIRLGELLSVDQETKFTLPRSKKRRLNFASTHFIDALKRISTLCPSSRLQLLRELAGATMRCDDAVALREVGEAVMTMSREWSRFSVDAERKIGGLSTDKSHLREMSMILKASSLSMMKLDVQAKKLEAKTNVDLGVLKDFVLGVHDRIEHYDTPPCFCMADVKDEDWRRALTDWHKLALIQTFEDHDGGILESGVFSVEQPKA